VTDSHRATNLQAIRELSPVEALGDRPSPRYAWTMRLFGRLLRAFFVLLITASVGSAIAAARLKAQLVPRGRPADDEVELVAIFESSDFTSTAKSLRRVDLTTIYGGGTLDLRLATLDPAGATLSARTIFGGYRVAVPGTWRVETHGIGLFGGFGDARKREWVDPNGPRLVLEGFALFGGLGVVSETPDLGPPRPTTLDQRNGFGDEPADNRGLVTDIEQAPPAPADL
jgi:hypothetical protein